MKNVIVIGLCCCSLFAFGQETLDIAILGTVHHFQSEHIEKQDMDAARQFVLDFKPDIFCIESVPSEDTLSLQEVFSKNMERADQLRDTLMELGLWPIQPEELTASLSEQRTNQSNHQQTLRGVQYYLNYDFFNAYYHWHGLSLADGEWPFLSDYQRNLEQSEFHNLIFPTARQMGITHLHGIDYRYGEEIFLSNNQKVMKKLLFRLKWRPIRSYLKIQKKYKKAEEEGRLLEYVNKSEFQDAFSALIDEIPNKLPRSTVAKDLRSYWLNRNEIMANRLVKVATEQEAKRIVLAVGSAHVTHIKRFLEAKGHRVYTYDPQH